MRSPDCRKILEYIRLSSPKCYLDESDKRKQRVLENYLISMINIELNQNEKWGKKKSKYIKK